MKIVQKLLLVLFTLNICQCSLAAFSHSHSTINFIDTIPQIEPEYKGNRIIVKSIKVLKKKGKSYKIQYKLVNNGRNKIKLGNPSSIPEDLILQFDKSLVENDLVDAKSAIIESIKKQSISIRPGQLIMGNKIKFTHQPIPPSDRIASELQKEVPIENIAEKNIVKNEILQIEERQEGVISKSKFDVAVEDIIEEVPLPTSELENPRHPNSSKQKLDSVKVEETILGETILVKENKNSNKLEIEETESILEVLPSQNSEIIGGKTSEVISDNASEFVQEENIDILPSDTKENLENESSNVVHTEIPDTILVEEIENPENVELVDIQNTNEKLCADLIIENVEIKRKNKRFVLVNYTIKNIGNIPISLHGETKKEDDNIAIQSHFTRSHNLTRGSIPIGFSFIKKGNRDIKGMMIPGESITLKLKVETSKVTKFTPVLALTLNPSSVNFECNRLNNVFFIDIADKAPAPKNSLPLKPSTEETSEKISTLEN